MFWINLIFVILDLIAFFVTGNKLYIVFAWIGWIACAIINIVQSGVLDDKGDKL